jgi:hypothetical protein
MKEISTFLRKYWPGLVIYGITGAAVMVMLWGILFPDFGTGQVKTLQTSELSRSKDLWLSCKEYATDHDGNFPPSLEALGPEYVRGRDALVSLFAPDLPDGYEYTPGLTDSSPTGTELFKERRVPKGRQQITVSVDGFAQIERGK